MDPAELQKRIEEAAERLAAEFVFLPIDDTLIERYRHEVSDIMDWPLDGVEVELTHGENGYVLSALLIPKTITVSITKASVDDENRS